MSVYNTDKKIKEREGQRWREISQNHGKLSSSGPTTLLKWGHLKQVAQNRVQAAFEGLQERRLYNLSGQPDLVFDHPRRKNNNNSVLPCSDGISYVLICACYFWS